MVLFLNLCCAAAARKKEAKPVKDFFSRIKAKVLVGVLVLLAAMMAYAGANNRLTTAPQEVIGLLLTPLQRAAAGVKNSADSLADRYTRIDEILEENEQLREENNALEQKLLEYDRLKAENDAFKSLMEIEETKPEYSYLQAFVIGRDGLEQFGGFTIDKGTMQGVKTGDAVVSENNYLVGVIVEANLTSSKVLSVLSPSFNAAGVISRTRENGILTGSTDYAFDGKCIFTKKNTSLVFCVRTSVVNCSKCFFCCICKFIYATIQEVHFLLNHSDCRKFQNLFLCKSILNIRSYFF